MSEAKKLTAYDAGLLSDYGGGNVEWWQDYIRAELERAHEFYADQFDAERAKVEALEGLNAAAAADGLSKIADHWRDRATAAEAEAAGVRSAVKRARKQLAAVMAFDVKSDRALKAAQETLRAALAKEKPDAGE